MPAGRPDLRGRTILAVFAHPDDESLACGGTLALASDAHARVIVLCATRGERGSVSNPALVPDGDLGRVRAHELRDAAAVLGISDVLILDHPDGDLRWADVASLHDDILMTVDRYKPDAVITFDEDGLYWHLDHIGVHERTTTALASLGPSAPLLYYVTIPKGVIARVVAVARAKSGAPPDSSVWGIHPAAFGESARPPTLLVDVQAVAGRKLAALRCHQTQMGPQNPFAWIDDDDARQAIGLEQFRRADLASDRRPLLEEFGTAATTPAG